MSRLYYEEIFMETYISLLRGLNVGKTKRIKMEALCKLYESLNFNSIKIYLQTGNIIFQSQHTPPLNLATKIENKIKEVFGFNISILVKTPAELHQIIQHNPFNKEIPNKVYITFLFEKFVPEMITNEIDKVKDISEKYYICGKEIYLYCPNGYGITKLSNNFFEKKLNLNATTRNLHTVSNLLAISEKKFQ